METTLMSVFTIIILTITIFFLHKAFFIAYKRNELSLHGVIAYSLISIVASVLLAIAFPIGYEAIFNAIYN